MKLVFVYNADSGMLNAYLDSLHKVVSPETYDCNLCALTHGAFTEDNLWKSFRENTSHEMVFLHRDEFTKQFEGLETELPVVFSERKQHLEPFISKKELNEMNSAESLIETIMTRAKKY